MLVLAITTMTINVGVATGHDMHLHPDKDSRETESLAQEHNCFHLKREINTLLSNKKLIWDNQSYLVNLSKIYANFCK